MEGIKLKCQFCPLMDFSSAYKIIPHIYFGHRKKITKYVRDNSEINLKCPLTSCEYSHSEPVVTGTPPELVYTKMAEMFLVMEDHIITSHTKEKKLVVCPYCQKDLSNIVYWVHLEEHMNQAPSSPATPAKTASPANATIPSPASASAITTSHASVSTPTTPAAATPDQNTTSPNLISPTAGTTYKTSSEATAVTVKEISPAPEQKEPVATSEQVTLLPTDNRPVTRRAKQKSQEEIKRELLEIEKKIQAKKKEDEARKKKEEEAKRLQIEAEQRRFEEEKMKQEEAELKKKQEEELQKKLKEEEERRCQEEALRKRIEEDMRKKMEEEMNKQKELELIRQKEEELKRIKEEEERQRLKEIERKRRDEEERRRMEEEQRRQKEEDLKRQVEEQMRLLREGNDKPKEKPKEDKLERPGSDDKMDTRVSPRSSSRSREVSGDADKSLSGRRRSLSGDKKTSSVWRGTDKDNTEEETKTVDQKQKPIITEEMERSIIYGGFKKKETREDKLVAVKREIEARFKAEEERRRKIMEEKRKAEEKEREKMKIAEEKLRREREKLKEEKKKTRKRLEQLEKGEEPEPMEEDEVEEDDVSDMEPDETEESVPTSPKRQRSKSPDQYEKIKMEIRKIDKEIEKKSKARKVEKKIEDSSRSSSITPEPELELVREEPKKKEVAMKPVVDYQVEDEEEEEELDDLEIMMREFQERQTNERKQTKSETKPSEDSLASVQQNYKSEAKSSSPVKSPTIPAGFDKDGHPLDDGQGVISLTLTCDSCKEDGSAGSGGDNVYQSAYQLLAHVFLTHRKKIVSRSRKARKMTLSCPESCGYQTSSSDQGVSIDFFNSQLPLHLSDLCDHIRAQHTGEDTMDLCQYCSLALDHKEAWSWQHLANHRDARRVYCSSCQNFPFKNEEHRCSGTVSAGASVTGHTLEQLARAVETGVVRPEELGRQRHLATVSVWVCWVCDSAADTLSQCLEHMRTHHLVIGHKMSHQLRCWCCNWKPLRSDHDVVALHSLISHCVTEHNHPSWSDENFEIESRKLETLLGNHEKKLTREKEEREIVIPRLPKKCTHCTEILRTPATWKYHVLAHKFGQVFCSTCLTCVLGHQFQDHKLTCAEEAESRVKVVKYRGDTWLDVKDTKIKVFYKYHNRQTVASCEYQGVALSGAGINHNIAAAVLKTEVQKYLEKELNTVPDEKKQAEAEADRQALVDMFVELARRDQVAARTKISLKMNNQEIPVTTDIWFSKTGKISQIASVMINNREVSEKGATVMDAVNNLAQKLRHQLTKSKCQDCGTQFFKKSSLKLHRRITCVLLP